MSDRQKDLFEVAVDLPEPRRHAYLTQACGGDAVLFDQLVALLRAHDEAGDFLEHPTGLVEAATAAADLEPALQEDADLAPGRPFANFVLIDRLGRGGFGSVWRARQHDPVAREVALKVLHAGVDSERAIVRFQAECQSLAQMRHPSIAKVFDTGIAASGRPWMTMELVEGTTIAAHCERRHLGLRERLQLFVQVCHAVQHAHSKGVVHRDLKPANVLVVDRDGAPQPVVVDFGIAAAVDERVRDEHIAHEQHAVGTPEYMSPEQVPGAPQAAAIAVDTRTDVHALGAMLYELATGVRAFERGSGPDAVAKVMRRIREEMPAPPSQLAAAKVPAGRRPPRELDWIIARAMAKDPAARYPAASALGDDVQRVLDHEPVSVGPRSSMYRLAKFARRHRLTFAAALFVVVMSTVATVVATRGWLDARQSQQVAVAAERRARSDQQQAERASQRAQRALDLIDDLWESADPARFGRADYPVRELFADFERMLPSRVAGEPEVELRVRLSLARVQRILGAFDRAAHHAERAVAIALQDGDSEAGATALLEHARVLFDRGDVAAAAACIARAEVTAEDTPVLAADLLETQANCEVRQGQRDAAIATAERALALRMSVGDPLLMARSSMQLANLHGSLGRADVALEHLAAAQEALAPLGDDHPDRLVALQHQAFLLMRRGDRDAAEAVLRECVSRRRELYGDAHPQVAWSEADLGWLLHEGQRDAEAEPLLRHAVTALQARLGESHLYVTEASQRLGAVLVELEQLDEAEQLLRGALERYRRLPAHPVEGLVGCLGNLAGLLWQRGDRQAALQIQGEAMETARNQLPRDHFVVSVGMTNKAWMLAETGQREAAAALLQEALPLARAAGRHGEARVQRARLVKILRDLGRSDEADVVERDGERD